MEGNPRRGRKRRFLKISQHEAQFSDSSGTSSTIAAKCSDTMNVVTEADIDQGHYEMEVLSGAEGGLQECYKHCQKNPGHKDFIAVQDFTKSHLPEDCQHDLVVDYIKALADLTICLVIEYTSPDRPDSYPLAQMRGKKCLRVGTGWVDNVGRTYTNKPCPCLQCKNSTTPVERWTEVSVFSAKHVVFDTEEALHTTCELFYDNDDQEEDDSALLLGWEMLSGDIKEDVCCMKCVLHTSDIVQKLEDMEQLRDDLQEKVGEEFHKLKDNSKLAVVVSHPHGCSKHVSVGEWTDRHIESDKYGILSSYAYSSCTCPGCSGAPVYIFGQLLVYNNHAHSGRGDKDGINISGLQWEDSRDSLSSQGSTTSLSSEHSQT